MKILKYLKWIVIKNEFHNYEDAIEYLFNTYDKNGVIETYG